MQKAYALMVRKPAAQTLECEVCSFRATGALRPLVPIATNPLGVAPVQTYAGARWHRTTETDP